MIKKMYVEKNKLENNLKNYKAFNLYLCNEKDKLHNKPVWVSDRDPHDNVRKVLEKLEKVNKYLELGNMPKTAEYYKMAEEHLTFALKKDIKNFDEGAG